MFGMTKNVKLTAASVLAQSDVAASTAIDRRPACPSHESRRLDKRIPARCYFGTDGGEPEPSRGDAMATRPQHGPGPLRGGARA